MNLPEGTEVIHQPVRLRVMTLLYRHGDIGAAEAQRLLDVTPGNLDAHAKKLAAAGLVETRRALQRGGFEARLRLTPAGAKAFEAYLRALEGFLEEVR